MDQVAAFFIGLISATVGAISAGGGLISIPAMIFLGLSPISAIATTRLNLFSGGLSATVRYTKANVIPWRQAIGFAIVAIPAGVIGPKLLLHLDPNLVEKLIAILMLIMLPVMWSEKEIGTIQHQRSQRRRSVGLLAVFLVLLYAVGFGAGGGILMIYTCVYFFGMTVTESNATGFVSVLIAVLISLILYAHHGVISWHLGVPSLLGALVGGYIGANFALQKGVAWVKVFLSLIIVGSAIKLLFF
jgi:uncharacterized membrane protein YfcA